MEGANFAKVMGIHILVVFFHYPEVQTDNPALMRSGIRC